MITIKTEFNVPLVSVIIPVFNSKVYISEALDSVINQTYKNLEIIIIDDGSTDGSGKICDEYAEKDNRIRVFHQKNIGVSAARNAGLDLAAGDFLAFLDSDDAYELTFIDSMMTAMIQNNADIVMCRYTEHKTTGKMSFNRHAGFYPVIAGGGTRNYKFPSQLALRQN